MIKKKGKRLMIFWISYVEEMMPLWCFLLWVCALHIASFHYATSLSYDLTAQTCSPPQSWWLNDQHVLNPVSLSELCFNGKASVHFTVYLQEPENNISQATKHTCILVDSCKQLISSWWEAYLEDTEYCEQHTFCKAYSVKAIGSSCVCM